MGEPEAKLLTAGGWRWPRPRPLRLSHQLGPAPPWSGSPRGYRPWVSRSVTDRPVPWTLEQGAVASRLTLTGHVDIFEAAAFHEVLVGLARRGADVHVDLSACQDLDGSAIQLLLAFRRAREGHVALTGAEGRVSRLLARFGLAGAQAWVSQT